jgi:hypothetical protein
MNATTQEVDLTRVSGDGRELTEENIAEALATRELMSLCAILER